MKSKKDDGLAYLQRLGMKNIKDFSKVYTEMEKLFGAEYTNEYKRIVGALLAKDDPVIRNCLYTQKNKTLETAITISGWYYADFYRKVCNWISENERFVTGRILDVGCDCGIITCFLALRFPNSTVVGIDRVEGSIDAAKELAKKLNLKNVMFVKSSIIDYTNNPEFDTVISSRTIHENIYGYHFLNESWFKCSLKDVIYKEGSELNIYTEALALLTKPGGHILQIEKINEIEDISWHIAMNSSGFYKIVASENMNSESFDNLNENFVRFVFVKKLSDVDNDTLISNWIEKLASNIYKYDGIDENVEYMVDGIDADIMLEYYNFLQENGIFIKGNDGMQILRCGWVTIRKEKKYVLHAKESKVDDNGQAILNNYLLVCNKEYAMSRINEHKQACKQDGLIVKSYILS